jgi:hypothetical protein
MQPNPRRGNTMKIGSLLLATTLALAVPAVMTGAYAASPELPKIPKAEQKNVKLEEKKILKDEKTLKADEKNLKKEKTATEEKKILKDEKKLKADEKILKQEKTATKGKPAAEWNQVKNKTP